MVTKPETTTAETVLMSQEIGTHGMSLTVDLSVTTNVPLVQDQTMVNVPHVNQERFSVMDGVQTMHHLDFITIMVSVLLVTAHVLLVAVLVMETVSAVTLASNSKKDYATNVTHHV